MISKEELLNSVWGDAAVTEGSLTRCIWLLRRVLGDDIRQPRYIETVATVGYRFVCKVEVSEDNSGRAEAAGQPDGFDGNDQVEARANRGVAGAVAEPQALIGGGSAGEAKNGTQKGGSRERVRRWLLPGVAVLVISLAAAIWYLRRPLPPLRVTGYTQITHDGHRKSLVGTDGSRLYFNDSPWSIAQVAISGGAIHSSRLRCRTRLCWTFRRMGPAFSFKIQAKINTYGYGMFGSWEAPFVAS